MYFLELRIHHPSISSGQAHITNLVFDLFRMKSLVNFFELGIGDVGVNLRRREIFVAEQFLHGSEIRAIAQQIGCEGMA